MIFLVLRFQQCCRADPFFFSVRLDRHWLGIAHDTEALSKMVFDETEAGSEALNFGEVIWKCSRRQLGPSATNSDHHCLRT